MCDAAAAGYGRPERPVSRVASSISLRALAVAISRGRSGFWLHLDLDVLSCFALPAVDYPTKEGLTWEQLLETLRPAFADDNMLGASVVIFNPTKDPEGVYAARIVQLLRDAADDADVSLPRRDRSRRQGCPMGGISRSSHAPA